MVQLCAFQAGVRCSKPTVRAAQFRTSFTGQGLPRVCAAGKRQQVVKGVFAANPVGDAAKYLADAAKQIFSPANTGDEPDWTGSGSGFSGAVVHHEASADRLRALYSAVRQAREQITGCTDPEAANYNPSAVVDDGTCNYIAESTEETGMTEDLRTYVTNTLSKVWSSDDKTAPKDWKSTGYSYSGQRVSQRDIMRLLQYEKYVKKALDEAEKVEEKN